MHMAKFCTLVHSDYFRLACMVGHARMLAINFREARVGGAGCLMRLHGSELSGTNVFVRLSDPSRLG